MILHSERAYRWVNLVNYPVIILLYLSAPTMRHYLHLPQLHLLNARRISQRYILLELAKRRISNVCVHKPIKDYREWSCGIREDTFHINPFVNIPKFKKYMLRLFTTIAGKSHRWVVAFVMLALYRITSNYGTLVGMSWVWAGNDQAAEITPILTMSRLQSLLRVYAIPHGERQTINSKWIKNYSKQNSMVCHIVFY